MASPVVIYDACVIYCSPVRDLLIRIANAGLLQARWSECILDECFRSILKNRPDLSSSALSRTRELMIQAVADCMVVDFEGLINLLSLPDPNDRHVLAAAIAAQAESIITFNLRDFPPAELAKHGIDALSPDTLVLSLLDVEPSVVVGALVRQAEALKAPPHTIDELLGILACNGMRKSAERLRSLVRVDAQVALRDKPFMAMDDLETVKAWDRIFELMHSESLTEARNGARHFTIAAMTLFMPNETPLHIYSQSEHGDDEGLDLVREFYGQVIPALNANETVRVELVRGHLENDGSWACSSESFSCTPSETDESLDRASFTRLVNTARTTPRDTGVSVAMLALPGGAKRVVFYDWEPGDGEARQNTAELIRSCRRSKLLAPEESISHVQVKLLRTSSGWKAFTHKPL